MLDMKLLRNSPAVPALSSAEKGAEKNARRPLPASGRGRARSVKLIFAVDATSSRQTTLEASRLAMAAMFLAIEGIATPLFKVLFFRGDEIQISARWMNAKETAEILQTLACKAGYTKIESTFVRALQEAETTNVAALIFLGDTSEEEAADILAAAEKLRRKRLPVYLFHDLAAGSADCIEATALFQEVARITEGAYAPLNTSSGAVLAELLASVSAFSEGGHEALQRLAPPQSKEAQALQSKLLALPPPSR